MKFSELDLIEKNIIAALMLFCSGGIVYLIFQDIAPMSKLKKNGFLTWEPVLVFLLE